MREVKHRRSFGEVGHTDSVKDIEYMEGRGPMKGTVLAPGEFRLDLSDQPAMFFSPQKSIVPTYQLFQPSKQVDWKLQWMRSHGLQMARKVRLQRIATACRRGREEEMFKLVRPLSINAKGRSCGAMARSWTAGGQWVWLGFVVRKNQGWAQTEWLLHF